MLRLAVPERDELAIEGLADAGEHLQREVLAALLDASDRALAGAEKLGEVGLGHALVTPSIPDEVADAGQIVVRHESPC